MKLMDRLFDFLRRVKTKSSQARGTYKTYFDKNVKDLNFSSQRTGSIKTILS